MITFADALTKRAHWVAAKEEALVAEKFAEIFADSYFRLHRVVLDGDPRFIGGFWQHLATLWQTRTRTLTAFHPQPDGKA